MVQMEENTLNKYLQNIEDYVFIEEKIVTCVWLCQVLKVHINTAKQLLYAFVQGDGAKDKVSVTYLIGGELNHNSGIQLKLVKEEERDSCKSLFSNLTTDHIYSIQKSGGSLNSTDLFNSNPHFLVNPDGRRFCAIQPSKEIEKRDIKVPIVEVKKVIDQQQSKANRTGEKNVEKTNSSVEASEAPSKQKKVSPEKNNKQAPKAKPGGIASMFNKQAEKKKVEPTAEKNENKTNAEAKKKSGISGFFQKQPAKKDENKHEAMDVDCHVPIKENHNIIDQKKKVIQGSEEEKNKSTDNKNQKSMSKDKKLKGKENRNKRKKRDEEKEEDSRKKRKRIVSILSSDSESSASGDESENDMETEPPPAPLPVVEEEEEDIIPPTPGRKRVRKQVDKTYTDEDGFILTKKEYVYESCTDDEGSEDKNVKEKEKEDENVTKNSPSLKSEGKKPVNEKNSSKKQISPTNNKGNKQASIMNFFKKK